MSIERIREEAAKADQAILDLAKGANTLADEAGAPEVELEAAQPEVEQQTDQGVVADAATEDQPSANPDLEGILAESAKWEQRYRSLDGMIQARDRQIEQLHQLLAGMQSAPAADAVAEAPKQGRQLVGKADEEAFGADLIDLIRRAAKEESGDYVTKLESQIKAMQEQLEGVSQTTAVTVHDRFEQRLADAVPNWKRIDANPKFIEWLQANPTRNRVFAEAANSQDVAGVAYFFEEFAGKETPAPKPAIDPRLENQVAPGKAKSVAPQSKTQTEKKQWTRTEIADFYSNGRKRYSPEDYVRMERDVFTAQKENRVDFTR